jgi:hypothetical protein
VSLRRTAYDTHLTAEDPAAWEAGFRAADLLDINSVWARRLYEAIRDSDGVAFAITAASVHLAEVPWVEGFLLGVYGRMAVQP